MSANTSNYKTINDGKGKYLSRWSYRLGDVEERDGKFIARIYYNYAETKEDLDKPATKVFAAVQGDTEEQCYRRIDHLFRLVTQGDFEDY